MALGPHDDQFTCSKSGCTKHGRKKDVVVHYLTHHLLPREVPWVCPVCLQWQATQAVMKEHLLGRKGKTDHPTLVPHDLTRYCHGTLKDFDENTMVSVAA